MIHDTKHRLIDAASHLFAANGYSGASVRDICNLARSNPGAVSYHFGGKRQLYRTVLRHAVDRLARAGSPTSSEEADETLDIHQVARAVFERLDSDPVATRLLLRDLADGGSLAVEALEPKLRSALDALRTHLGHTDAPRAPGEVRTLFLELAAPVFLLAAGWPALARPLDLEDEDRHRIVAELVAKALAH
jgi:AcrR family transcriptional regulator